MPPQFLFDYTQFDFDHPKYDQEGIRAVNPHRGHMEHINGIVLADDTTGRICAFKDVHADEFWVPGHIPGRPILPGVIMIEAAAQMCSFYMGKFSAWKGFIGFGGAEEIKFRQQVVPGQRLIILGQKIWERHSRFGCKCQGVVNGSIAFEAVIIGTNLS
jgi:3-hydroxyacyl-[acyl-carrier-protein] dehydratase